MSPEEFKKSREVIASQEKSRERILNTIWGYEYPIETEGDVCFAWDRPLDPRDLAEQALHDHRPGEPGWERFAAELVKFLGDHGSGSTQAVE